MKSTEMALSLTISRLDLAALVRGISDIAHRSATLAESEGATTMYARVSHDGIKLASRIEFGRIADVSVSGAVEQYVRLARKCSVI